MSINSRLKQAISSFIAGSIDPGYASDSKTSELDVCVLYQEEANRCRVERQEPNCSRIIIAVECKHYESELNLDLARSFIGLTSELQVEGDCYFVSNTNSASVAKLLATRRLKWEQNVTPGSRNDVNRLRYAFQSNFKDFKARYGI